MSIRKGKELIASSTNNSAWGSIEGAIDNQADLVSKLANKAPLNSPNFSGMPLVPELTEQSNDLQITNKKYVDNSVKNYVDKSLENFESLPTQEGNSDKLLTTDGETAYWTETFKKPDESTITTNSNDKLQTVAIIEQNKNKVVKMWVGSKDEYKSLTTINDNWIYNITDDADDDFIPDLDGNSGKILSNDGTKILWVDNIDENTLVHRSGDETINGTKTFNTSPKGVLSTETDKETYKDLFLNKDTSLDSSTLPQYKKTYYPTGVVDKNGNYIGFSTISYTPDGTSIHQINVRALKDDGTDITSSISISIDKNGTITTSAPNPQLSSNSTEIATTSFVKSNIDSAISSKANSSDLTSHTDDKNNPHSVTKAQVGLGNVDNTSDVNKPISTATQNALNLKLDKSSIQVVSALPANPDSNTYYFVTG